MLYFKRSHNYSKNPPIFSEEEIFERDILDGIYMEDVVPRLRLFCRAVFDVLTDDQKRMLIKRFGAYDEVKR